MAHKLWVAKYEEQKSLTDLREIKQRIIYNKLSDSLISVQIPLPKALETTTTIDKNIQQRILDRHVKLIQQKKLDLLAIHIAKLETKFNQCEKKYTMEYNGMIENHRNLVKNKGMPITIKYLIDQRLRNIINRWKSIYRYKLNYYILNPYGDLEEMTKIQPNKLSPSMILNTTHTFNDEQLRLLDRGPSYVPPCQIHILTAKYPSLDDVIRKQYASLQHQLNNLFTRQEIDLNLSMNIENDIRQEFKQRFSSELPIKIQERALTEMKLVRTIRSRLKQNNLILRRTADNQNTFYLENIQGFEQKIEQYMAKVDIYEIVLNDEQQSIENDLKENIESINSKLETMNKKKEITGDLLKKLLIDPSKVELPYVYFLPDVSNVRHFFL